MSPKISIIIPMLNEEKVLPATLACISAQTSSAFELIIVDGMSNDRSCEIAQQWQDKIPRLTLLHAKKRGRGEQMNRGAASARGEWLLFSHADTLLPATAIESIESLSESVQAGCFHQAFSEPTILLRIISWMHNIRCRITGVMYGDQSMFVRRDRFHALKGFKAELIEDVKFSDALLTITQPVLLNETVLTDSRKFKQRGVLHSLWDVVKIVHNYHQHKTIPDSSKSFFSNIR